jgi:2-keto-4-pentenoate hydratase
MNELQIRAVTERLLLAWRTGIRQPVTDLQLEDEAAAYAVQRQVCDALGWHALPGSRVWKLGGGPGGLISTALVPENALQSSGWRVPAGYARGFGIEGELAIRLGRDLCASVDLDDVYNAVDAWMPAIELCDSRFMGGSGHSPLLKLADHQLSRALIVGSACKPTVRPDWRCQGVTLAIDGQSQRAFVGSHPFVDPLANVIWLARHATAQGMPLQAGDIIATGSWTSICWVETGQNISVCFPGFGSVNLVV